MTRLESTPFISIDELFWKKLQFAGLFFHYSNDLPANYPNQQVGNDHQIQYPIVYSLGSLLPFF